VWAAAPNAAAVPGGAVIAAISPAAITISIPLAGRLPAGAAIWAAAKADLALANIDAANAATFASDPAIAAVAIGNGRAAITLNNVPTPAFGTPASSSAACTKGQMMFDASYLYTCVAANTWRRTASSGF
jgi:hypothetical protein